MHPINQYPLVSIIIPVYNSAKYLRDTIQSALDQTWPNLELLIIDDGSTDHSVAIIDSFKHPAIKLFSQKNQGAATARNLGLSKVSGDYIQFLDSDDLLSKNKIEIQVLALLGSQNKIAVCSTVHFFDGSDPYQKSTSADEDSFLYSTDNSYEFLINLWGGNGPNASMVQTNSWLVPTALAKANKPWKEFFSPDDDGEYFARLMFSSEGIVYTPNCYNYYRKFKNTNSLSNRNTFRALEGIYKSILCKKETLTAKLDDERARKAIAKQLFDVLYSSYPKNPKLEKQIQESLIELNVKINLPVIGGRIINTIAKITGWKTAKRLQYSLAKIKNLIKST